MVTRTVHTILEVIAAANFMADAAQVERLAGTVADGHTADGTYLKVLLAHMQSRMGKNGKRRRAAAQTQAAEEVLNTVHEQLYVSVLKGVGPDELAPQERNRRGTFARSAAAAVRYFISRGGDVRTVDVATVTKAGLRNAVKPETPPPEGETRAERSFRKAQDTLVRSAQNLLARGDPEGAAQRIEAAMDALEAILESIPAAPTAQAQPDMGGTTTTIVGGQRPGARSTPASQPMLHRGA